ncbi:MAG: hypothetical protein ACOYJU_07565 [Anaerovoracaceae bacterium]
MKKRILSIAAVFALVFAMAACSGDSGKEYVTAEDYQMLLDKPYSGMTLDEVNKAIGMDGTLDEESTKAYDDGSKVYKWEGKDGEGQLTVTISKDGGATGIAMYNLPSEEDGEE